jgi:hypothetical protein
MPGYSRHFAAWRLRIAIDGKQARKIEIAPSTERGESPPRRRQAGTGTINPNAEK